MVAATPAAIEMRDLDVIDESIFAFPDEVDEADETTQIASETTPNSEAIVPVSLQTEDVAPPQEPEDAILGDYFELPEEFQLPGDEALPIADVPPPPELPVDQQQIALVDEADPLAARAEPFAIPGAARADTADGHEFQLSAEELRRLQLTLAHLPLNVKLAAEEILAEPGSDRTQLITFINLLVQDASPRIIARHATRILDRPVRVPDAFQKLGGLQQGQIERPSDARRRFRSLALGTVGVSVALILMLFLSWRFVYRPIRAASFYGRALIALNREEYQETDRLFDRATDLWQSRRRYYQFADAFIDKDQYQPAAEKYEQLLARYPFDKRGLLDYAYLEGTLRSNYDKSTAILTEALDSDQYDYDILAALGDDYIEWGDTEPERYEDARLSFARLLDEYGDRDPSLMRMLLYFIRTDNRTEVEYLAGLFEGDPEAGIMPYIYAELGGYFVDKDALNGVEAILIRALNEDNIIPEIHYHLARYYLRVNDLQGEERALNNSIALLEATEPLSNRRTSMLVDAYGRAAEDKYREDEYLTARRYYQQGIETYEAARARGALEPDAFYGRLYAGLGDIDYYSARDYTSAQQLYEQAERQRYSDRGLDYRQGFIFYRNGEYSAALNQFIDASGSFSNNRNLLFAQANALFNLQSYAAAQGYYSELVDDLSRERAIIDNLFIDENSDHAALIANLIRAYNNLGVSLVQLGERQGDSTLITSGLANLTRSNELAVNFVRDPETAARAESINLAYLNSRAVLYPRSGFDLQIFNAIPEDLQSPLQ